MRLPLHVLLAAPLAASALGAQAPDTDVWVASLERRGDSLVLSAPRNLTDRAGYDNQPAWVGNDALLYVAQHDGQTDVWRVDVRTGATRQLTRTAESEYSPTPTLDGRGFAVVRVEADSTQRLWRFDTNGGAPRLLLPDVRPVGYFAWSSPNTLALFVLGTPSMLQVARLGQPRVDTVALDISRSLQPVPRSTRVSFVHRAGGVPTVKIHDPATGAVLPLFPALEGSEDLAWLDGETALMARDAVIHLRRRGDPAWRPVADLSGAGIRRITRMAVRRDGRMIAFVAER